MKLQKYYQFNIDIKYEHGGFFPVFTDINGDSLPSYKEKLTPSQWKKASLYLDRDLIPFVGYIYTVKKEHQQIKTVKIR